MASKLIDISLDIIHNRRELSSFLRLFHILLVLLIWTTQRTHGDQERWSDDLVVSVIDESKPWKVASGPWLQEFESIAREINGELDYPQGDDPIEEVKIGVEGSPPLRCANIPEKKNLLSCTQPTCEQDSDCLIARYKCCDNGCVTSCIRGLRDSIVVDWEQQPLPQPDEETSWLIPEPDDKNSNGDCVFENRVIPEGIPFQYENHPCVCDSGEVDCDVFPQLPEI